MIQPWLRQIEVVVGPLPDWKVVGPLQPDQEKKAVRIYSDGTNDRLRVRFRLNKHAVGVPMPGLIEVYNLGPELRSVLNNRGAQLIIRAGWSNDELTELYSGSVQAAWSRREGSDIVTALVCLSGAGAVQRTYTDPTTRDWYAAPGASIGGEGVLLNFASEFPGISLDPKNIVVPDKVIGSRGYSFTGLLSECMNDLARVYGFTWAIVDDAFQANLDGIPLGRVVEINSKNGFLLRAEPMLSSAFQMQAGIVIHSLLHPHILPARGIKVESAVNPGLNGTYYAQSVTHAGDTHSTQWETITETVFVNAF